MAKTPTSTTTETAVTPEETHARRVRENDSYGKGVEAYTSGRKSYTKDSPYTATFYSAEMNRDTTMTIYTDPDNPDDFVVKTDERDEFTKAAREKAKEDAERKAEEEERAVMENPQV